MPCRSGSPQAVLDAEGWVALPAGATFSRMMTARITPTTPRTGSSRFLISTSVFANHGFAPDGEQAPVRTFRTPGGGFCQAMITPHVQTRERGNPASARTVSTTAIGVKGFDR